MCSVHNSKISIRKYSFFESNADARKVKPFQAKTVSERSIPDEKPPENGRRDKCRLRGELQGQKSYRDARGRGQKEGQKCCEFSTTLRCAQAGACNGGASRKNHGKVRLICVLTAQKCVYSHIA